MNLKVSIPVTPVLLNHVAEQVHRASLVNTKHPFFGSTHAEIFDLLNEGVELSLDQFVSDGPSSIHYEIPLGRGHTWTGWCDIDDDAAHRLRAFVNPQEDSPVSSL
ncbi:hypothetical protein HYZ99_01240 [Candidatus Peregrinibacteria bacterium]|nr:hypothetical protein [Candidatus Peregrinibacteria bacterium]